MSAHGGLLLQPMGTPPPAWPAVLARWRPDAGMLIVLVLAAALYLAGVRRLHRRGGRWPAGRTVAHLAGLVVITTVALGPLAFYGPVLFSADAAVHMLLMWLAPVPLAFGRPVTLALRAGPPRLRRALRAVLRSRTAGVLANPLVAFALLNLALVIPFYTPLGVAALRYGPVHDVQHLIYLALGCLLLWPLLGVDPVPGRIPFLAREALLIIGSGVYVLIGLVLVNGDRLSTLGHLTGLHRTWGPAPLLDQDYGGSVIAWVGNAMCYTYGLLLLILWIRYDWTRTRRQDREHDSLVAAGREGETELAGYNAWLASLERAERRP